MTKKDILDLRRRFTRDCTINRLAGCYVDCNKNRVLEFSENFLNLQEEEFYKYLEIAKKTLSGTIGNNILELEFPSAEEEPGGRQQFLYGLRDSELKNSALLDRLYEQIIEQYKYTGNYLILVFYDTYDVMSRTSDDLKLDESEETYRYLLTAICPVELSKPGLGYRADENRIGARVRDWVVGSPDIGFLFPAFDDRSSNIHRVDYYTKDALEPHTEFINGVLGCEAKHTATQQRIAFGEIVKTAYRGDEDRADEVLMDIQESFNDRVEALEEEGADPIILSEAVLTEVLEENDVDEEPAAKIREICRREFADEQPAVAHLVDARAIKANAPVKKERELVREVLDLKEQLKNAQQSAGSAQNGDDGDSESEYAVEIKISPDRAGLVHSTVIGERRYLVIPLSEDEHASVNGQEYCD